MNNYLLLLIDCLVEWSKTLDLGSNPKGRGFKSHSNHFYYLKFTFNYAITEITSVKNSSSLCIYRLMYPLFP